MEDGGQLRRRDAETRHSIHFSMALCLRANINERSPSGGVQKVERKLMIHGPPMHMTKLGISSGSKNFNQHG